MNLEVPLILGSFLLLVGGSTVVRGLVTGAIPQRWSEPTRRDEDPQGFREQMTFYGVGGAVGVFLLLVALLRTLGVI